MRTEVFHSSKGRLRYRVYGAGPPMILIHGLSGSAHWWNRNIPELSRHYQLYVVELVGYGRAWGQRSLSVEENALSLLEWLQALGLERVILVGHSMGGQIAMRMTEREPLRVRALVLACASGLVEGQVWRLAARKLPRALVTGRASFLPRIALDSARAGLPNLWRSASELLVSGVSELLPLLTPPTLVIWGGRDALVPVELGKRLAATIPNAQWYEIGHAGHVVMVDAPAEFNRAVLDFLAEVP